MLKIFVATIFVSGLAYAPIYVLDSTVVPQINALKSTYQNMDQLSQDMAASEDITTKQSYKDISASAKTLSKPLEQ